MLQNRKNKVNQVQYRPYVNIMKNLHKRVPSEVTNSTNSGIFREPEQQKGSPPPLLFRRSRNYSVSSNSGGYHNINESSSSIMSSQRQSQVFGKESSSTSSQQIYGVGDSTHKLTPQFIDPLVPFDVYKILPLQGQMIKPLQRIQQFKRQTLLHDDSNNIAVLKKCEAGNQVSDRNYSSGRVIEYPHIKSEE